LARINIIDKVKYSVFYAGTGLVALAYSFFPSVSFANDSLYERLKVNDSSVVQKVIRNESFNSTVNNELKEREIYSDIREVNEVINNIVTSNIMNKPDFNIVPKDSDFKQKETNDNVKISSIDDMVLDKDNNLTNKDNVIEMTSQSGKYVADFDLENNDSSKKEYKNNSIDPISMGLKSSSFIEDSKLDKTIKERYDEPNKGLSVLGMFGDKKGFEAEVFHPIYTSINGNFKVVGFLNYNAQSFSLENQSNGIDDYNYKSLNLFLKGRYKQELDGNISPIFRQYIIEPSLGLSFDRVNIERSSSYVIGTVYDFGDFSSVVHEKNSLIDGNFFSFKPGIGGKIFIDRENLFSKSDELELTESERTSPTLVSILSHKQLSKYISLGLDIDKTFFSGKAGEYSITEENHLRDLLNEYLNLSFNVGLDGDYLLELKRSFGKYDDLNSVYLNRFIGTSVLDKNFVGRLIIGVDDDYGKGTNLWIGAEAYLLRDEISRYHTYDDPRKRYNIGLSFMFSPQKGFDASMKLPLMDSLYKSMGLVKDNGEADRNTVIEALVGFRREKIRDYNSPLDAFYIGLGGSIPKVPKE
jgi:hypothetical protein